MLTLSSSAAGWRWMAGGVGEGAAWARVPARRGSGLARPPESHLRAQLPFWVYGSDVYCCACVVFSFYLDFPLVI